MKPPFELNSYVHRQQQNLGEDLVPVNAFMPPMASTAAHSKAVVLLLLICF